MIHISFPFYFLYTGHYIYLEASAIYPYTKAELINKVSFEGHAKCVSFYYYMYGYHIGQLVVMEYADGHYDEATEIFRAEYISGMFVL